MADRVAVDPRTHARLRTFGARGMTDDAIIQALLDEVDQRRFIADLNNRADLESDWVELDVFEWGE